MPIVAFGLRLSAAAARFIFVIYLASFATPELVGSYGLVATLSVVFAQIAGLELNQLLGRRLHSRQWPAVRSDLERQIGIIAIGQAVLLALGYVMYGRTFGILFVPITVILLIEHWLTEIYRLLIFYLKPGLASGLLFLKNAGWAAAYIVLVEVFGVHHSFSLLTAVWAISLVLIILPLVIRYLSASRMKRILNVKETVKGVSSLLGEATPFIISALALSGVSTLDRLIIEAWFPIRDFGVYFVYGTYASIVTLVVSFSIGATVGPRCIRAFSSGSDKEYAALRRRVGQLYILVSVGLSAVLCVLAYPVISLFKSAEYLGQIGALYLLVAASGTMVLYEPQKLDLYLARRDRELTASNLFHLVLFLAFLLVTVRSGNLLIVASGVCAAAVGGYLFFLLHGARRLTGPISGPR